MSSNQQQYARQSRKRTAASVPSLRSRWNRAFALLTAMILLRGLAGVLGARLPLRRSGWRRLWSSQLPQPENHIQSVIGKLGAHSKLEAVSIALREGIVAAP